MTVPLISVPEAEEAIKAGGSAPAAQLLLLPEYIEAASNRIQEPDLAGPVGYDEKTFTKYLTRTVTAILLPHAPATALTVTVDDVAQASTAWTADPGPGMVHGVFGPGTVVVTYTVGSLEAVPADIKLACKVLVAWLWQATRQGARRDVDGVLYTPGFAVPNIVRELCAPHRVELGFA